MTFQPPPPPPSDNPPPPPPPPPGQWGPPPGGGYPPSQRGFDPKTVNPLDWGIIGAGVLAFIFSFINFYSGADVSFQGRSVTVDGGSASAWNDVFGGGFFAWFAMLFAILGAVAVALEFLAPQVKLTVANRVAGLILFAAAALFEIIAIFVTPSYSAFGASADANHGFGFWASLIVILAGLVLSLMRVQQTGTQLPGGLSSKIPNIGGHGPQGGTGGSGTPPQPGAGYGPPPGSGYGPPSGP